MPWCKQKHDINIFEVKKIFFEKKQTKVKFDLLKSGKMNNFFGILEFWAFYIKYKNANFTELTFVVEPMLNI